MATPQDQVKIIAECKKNGTKWIDESFPALNNSICPGKDWKDTWAELDWKRVDKIPAATDNESKTKMFDGEIKDI